MTRLVLVVAVVLGVASFASAQNCVLPRVPSTVHPAGGAGVHRAAHVLGARARLHLHDGRRLFVVFESGLELVDVLAIRRGGSIPGHLWGSVPVRSALCGAAVSAAVSQCQRSYAN